jgi:hypothetical protein
MEVPMPNNLKQRQILENIAFVFELNLRVLKLRQVWGIML